VTFRLIATVKYTINIQNRVKMQYLECESSTVVHAGLHPAPLVGWIPSCAEPQHDLWSRAGAFHVAGPTVTPPPAAILGPTNAEHRLTPLKLSTVLAFHVPNYEKLYIHASKVCQYSASQLSHETTSIISLVLSASLPCRPPASACWQIMRRALPAHDSSANKSCKQNSTQLICL
jgi:hypothetical protein